MLIENQYLNKGDKIKLKITGIGRYSVIEVLEKAEKSGWDDMTNFEELLNDAHKNHELTSIKTEMISYDWEKKNALVKATVTGEIKGDEVIFQAYGDATQDNISTDHVKQHWIRMAETRAIARALRWFTNNAAVAEEETDKGSIDEDPHNVIAVANASNHDGRHNEIIVKTNDEIKAEKQGVLE